MTTTTTRDLSTTDKVIEFLEEALGEVGNENFTDYCFAYGEPGYTDPTGETPLLVFGSYWCRCDEFEEADANGYRPLHDIARHHQEEFSLLEEQGVEFLWYDEWIIDHQSSKAYRTEADGAFWMPSYLWWESDILTPDSPIEAFIDYATEDTWDDAIRGIPERALPQRWDTLVGWEQWPDDTSDFRNDWYGNNDDPKTIRDAIRAEHGEDTAVVFICTESHMFGMRFEAYYRLPETEEED